MKFFILIILFITAKTANSQQKIYNNKINRAGKVTIKNGTVFITKADTIYLEKRTELKLISTIIEKDTNNIYTTTYILSPNDGSTTFSFDIGIKFDKPILGQSCISIVGPYPTGLFHADTNCGTNWVHARGNITGKAMQFIVRSQTEIKAEFMGVME